MGARRPRPPRPLTRLARQEAHREGPRPLPPVREFTQRRAAVRARLRSPQACVSPPAARHRPGGLWHHRPPPAARDSVSGFSPRRSSTLSATRVGAQEPTTQPTAGVSACDEMLAPSTTTRRSTRGTGRMSRLRRWVQRREGTGLWRAATCSKRSSSLVLEGTSSRFAVPPRLSSQKRTRRSTAYSPLSSQTP